MLLKNNNQPSKFEDLIGFIKGFMNLVTSHLATRKALWVGCTEWKVFVGGRVGQEAIIERKDRIIFRPRALSFLFGGR